jgi:hypothetical protein
MEQRECLISQHPARATMSFEEVLRIVEELSKEQKMELAQKLGSPLSVVLGDYNYISNSFVLQLNGDSEKISEQFKNLPPETLQKLVEAIAMWIGQNKPPS